MPAAPSYMPTDLAQAANILGTRFEKKIGNNTFLVAVNDGSVAVRYHNTFIVKFLVNGAVTLHTGGYRTTTTKARLHEVARGHGWNLSQRSYAWYLTHPASGVEVEFFDGVDIASLDPAMLNPV